jgi:hypothetical protein
LLESHIVSLEKTLFRGATDALTSIESDEILYVFSAFRVAEGAYQFVDPRFFPKCIPPAVLVAKRSQIWMCRIGNLRCTAVEMLGTILSEYELPPERDSSECRGRSRRRTTACRILAGRKRINESKSQVSEPTAREIAVGFVFLGHESLADLNATDGDHNW